MQTFGTVDIFKGSGLTIHSYMSPEDGEMVRSHILETENHLVIIDVQIMRAYAQEVRRYADRLGKPVDRVIISHSHPDHWMGSEYFEDLPRYALPMVSEELQVMSDFWINMKGSQLGDLVADRAVLPTETLDQGSFTLDGVTIKVSQVTGAEATVTTVIELPEEGVLLPQDLVYNHVYLFVGELHGPDRATRCFLGWRRALADLQQGEYDLVLPGHGEPTTPDIFAELTYYLYTVESIVNDAAGPDDFKQRVMKAYPDYRIPLMLDFSVFTLFPEYFQ